MKRILAVAALLVIAVIAPAGMSPASAHASLVSSDPPAGATIAALPEAVTLEFSEPPVSLGTNGGNKLTVVDPMRMTISAADTNLEGTKLSVVLNPSMKMDGTYHVEFRAVSDDGHVVEGAFQFTVKADASPAPTGVSDLPTSGAATLLVSATGAGIPHGEGSPSGSALATFDIDLGTSTMCYRIITKDLTNVTAAHVHAADMTDMTISDEISIPVDLAAVDSGSSVCRAQRRDDLAVLVSHPERFALVLHAVGFPEGAVGGSFTVEKSTVVMASTAPSATPVQATDAHAGMSMTSTVPLALRVLIAALVVIAVIASVAGINRRGRNPKAAS